MKETGLQAADGRRTLYDKRGCLATYTRDTYFSTRFSQDPSRAKLWRVLCRYLQRDIGAGSTVLELGGGYCDFINYISASEKHVIDIFDGIRNAAGPGVTAHVQSCTYLPNLASDTFHAVFASNLFEHLTRDELQATLAEVLRVLRPGGRLLIIQPNFRYAYKAYFDDYTHIQIFTDRSLADLLVASGFVVDRVVPRFLPFSVKSCGPKWPWLLRLYLSLPWRPWAGQMYLIVRKPERA